MERGGDRERDGGERNEGWREGMREGKTERGQGLWKGGG